MELSENAKQARRLYFAAYRAKNKDRDAEKNKAYQATWRKRNPEKIRQYNANYWESKAKQDIELITYIQDK